ncbi:hypothetical protein QAD02_001350 [Eretmocerus hayati]|uniref:Uncharacterized protein n=1 Tax=Eretmocerus hayati TaxID=131215 RepID=A0ACC2NHJ3_9HYME|nr:hypothetical protein QAD02_001350 [Eretmocerus hayati]
MLPLKVLKKQAAFDLIAACVKRSKEIQHASGPMIQASCLEHDHPTGPINAVTSYWRHRFETEGVPEPLESIEHIIAHVIGSNKDSMFEEDQFDEKQLEKLKILCHRRLTKMPLEYVTEEGTFKDTRLKLCVPIFMPESQSEILVDLLIKHISRSCSSICTVLEIGCGAGSISLSLLRSCDSQVRVIAIDTNEIACELTLHNAEVLKLDDRITILHATLEDDGKIVTSRNLSNDEGIDFLEESFDFIVSNPPCTPTNEIPKLQKEFEDVQARNGGEDGLKVIRPLLFYTSERLKDNGVLLLEILPSQPEKVRNLIEEKYSQKLKLDHIYEDCSSDERILEITKISELETTQAN